MSVHEGVALPEGAERPKHQPLSPKTPERASEGYSAEDFGEDYWLAPDPFGNRRIDRSADSMMRVVFRLMQLDLIPFHPKILDVGAGAGNIVHQFRKGGHQADGCEFGEAGRRIALREFEVDLKECDLRKRLPYKDKSYNFVMCVGVLTMIPKKDMTIAISELHRVMDVGGVLLVNLMNPNPVQNEPHLTSLPIPAWWRMFYAAGLVDITSVWPPQREGIGMGNEFCGLFRRLLK